jgi:hypothetical protein
MLSQLSANLDTQSRPDRNAAFVQPLSLNRIAAALQVVLATRRVARSDEHEYWYSVARGM